jgi:hypothetical protein
LADVGIDGIDPGRPDSDGECTGKALGHLHRIECKDLRATEGVDTDSTHVILQEGTTRY